MQSKSKALTESFKTMICDLDAEVMGTEAIFQEEIKIMLEEQQQIEKRFFD
jgi:hypothetical protein